MNCCNDFGKCVEDDGCPVRRSHPGGSIPAITRGDDPPLGFDDVMRYVGAFMAGIGFTAALICAAAFWGL